MCGLFAIWRPGGVDRAEISRALDRMATRGPDARATSISADGRLGLGHLRLAILDLSKAADQPMSSADGRWTMVYNGEVVNFRAVRATLGPRSDFRTDSDTEVLIESFARRGPEAMHDWVGMFAFALADEDEHLLHVARDRFGIKPLYFTRLADGGIAFASEIPPLLAVSGRPVRPDEDVIFTYLETGVYDAFDRTFFAGVGVLPPGCHGRLDTRTGAFDTYRWYDFVDAVNRTPSPSGDLVEAATRAIEDAIDDHLVADVAVGLNVSGGVDSSVLTALTARRIRDLHVFTQDYEPPYSEIEWVRRVVGGATLHRVALDSDVIRAGLDAAVRRQAEPFGGVTVIGYDALYRAADEAGVTVLLDGNGVDECFLGYGKYRAIAQGRLATTAGASIDGTAATMSRAIAPALRARADALTVPDLSKAFPDPVRAAAATDLLYTKIPRGLRFNDRVSMGRSKELRVPFLDHRLVEFAYRIPRERLLHDDVTKALFRTLASRIVGPQVAGEPKREVQSPQREWLATSWRDLVSDLLGSESFAAREWVDPRAALDHFETYRAGDRTNSFAIWQWINLELWARTFLDS